MPNIDTFFIVTVNDDGTFTTYAEMPDIELKGGHQATTYDVYQACKQIVREFDNQMLASTITNMVVGALKPSGEPSIADKLRDALKERGIDPESIKPTA